MICPLNAAAVVAEFEPRERVKPCLAREQILRLDLVRRFPRE